jgi:hypothetical protein
METGGPGSGGGDLSSISRRLEILEQKLKEAERSDSGAKKTARLVTIIIAVVAVAGVLYLLYPIIDAFNNSERYSEALYAEFEETVQPAVSREFQQSIEKVGPVIVRLARQQLDTRQEEIVMTVDKEMMTFFSSMETLAETELAERVTTVEDGVKKRFATLFPDLAEDKERWEIILGNADLALESAVTEIVTDNFTPHLEALAGIETRIRQFPVPARIQSMGDAELGEEFNRALAEYAIVIIRDLFLEGTQSLETPAVTSANTN